MDQNFRCPPQAIANALSDVLKGRTVCDIGCGEGDEMVSMARYANRVVGMEVNQKQYQRALDRGLEVVGGDYHVDPVPVADVYYFRCIWGGYLNVYLLVHRLLSMRNFNGYIVVAGDAAIEREADVVLDCAKIGELRNVEFGKWHTRWQSHKFILAIIDASKFVGRNSCERRAVITLAIGEAIRDLREIVEPAHVAYAKRSDADYIVIDQPRIHHRRKVKYEKFQIYDHFEDYDRILYLDLDAIPSPSCPDLFSLVPPDRLGVVFERQFYEKTAATAMKQLMKTWPKVEWHGDYFNSGVIMASKQHRELFAYDDPLPKHLMFSDQTVMNYRAAKYRYDFFELGVALNFMWMQLGRGEKVFDMLPAHIVHFAGLESPEKLALEITNAWSAPGWHHGCQQELGKETRMFSTQTLRAIDVMIEARVEGGYRLQSGDKIFELNECELMIFQLCDGHRRLCDIVRLVGDAYSIDSDQILKKVESTLRELYELGFVRAKHQYVRNKDFIDIWCERLVV